MALLPVVSILGLATAPACGAAQAGSEFARRLTAIAIHESAGGDPFVIGVNADPARGLPAAMLRSASARQAATKARSLIVQGRSIDLGLMGINSRQMARHSLTVEQAFDACASMRAGAEHYADDVQAAIAFDLAHRRYNTGGFERGGAYVANISQIMARIRSIEAPVNASSPSLPPPKPLCAPAWDGWALATCRAHRSASSPAGAPASAAPAIETSIQEARNDTVR